MKTALGAIILAMLWIFPAIAADTGKHAAHDREKGVANEQGKGKTVATTEEKAKETGKAADAQFDRRKADELKKLDEHIQKKSDERKRLDERIAVLQAEKSCVQAATDADKLKECRKKAHDERTDAKHEREQGKEKSK